ncbi:hypothetical protein Syun_023599 [Stephania yunnanensis]|uniref:Uncharacterized protein n=1 Tax=Stephania yunnanensis TaxID=152371 RepID=A0AAP0FNC8_9MAGN
MDELSKAQHQLAFHTHDDERREELKAFDDTKAGVKGLVDAGVTKIPRIFINPFGLCSESSTVIAVLVFHIRGAIGQITE